MKRRRAQSEAQIQRAVFDHLRARGAKGMFAFHPANGGYRKPIEAAILKSMGVVAGVPDVIAIHNGRVFAMEIKAEGGPPRRNPRLFHWHTSKSRQDAPPAAPNRRTLRRQPSDENNASLTERAVSSSSSPPSAGGAT